MFLATTALTEFWDPEQEIFFLGSWCTRYDRGEDWHDLHYQIMPSPWDDRDEFHRACHYLDACYDRCLTQLVEYLNRTHGVSYDRRYWQVIVGPWLLWYLHITYDRYVHLCRAFEAFPTLTTYVLDPAQYHTPIDMPDFVKCFLADGYNLQVFSEVLANMGLSFPTRQIAGGDVAEPQPADSSSKSLQLRRFLSRVKAAGNRWRTQYMNSVRAWEVGLFEMGWSSSMHWRLAQLSRLKMMPMDWSFDTPCGVYEDMTVPRRRLSDLSAANEFENVLVRSLPGQFPVRYLEGYKSTCEQIHRTIKFFPRVIVSCMSWKFNEYFKFAAAQASLKNSRLVPAQHGGGYGLLRFVPTEKQEREIADRYMVWGWANGDATVTNVPAPKLSQIDANVKARKQEQRGDEIALITTDQPRYLYYFVSVPLGSQWAQYGEWQLRFIRALSESLQTRVAYRPYETDMGHAFSKQVKDALPNVRITRDDSIAQVFATSRLVVIDHAITTMLESLAANAPTVLFWDPNVWEVRAEAEEYLSELRTAGIFFASPEDAAAKVSEVYDDPEKWWQQAHLQKARRAFVERFAYARADWASLWSQALGRELAIQRGAS
jgi:putative transferase (TIGR04331 family)